MPRLVALDLPGGDSFVDAVRRCFDAGEAIWPVDQRLPEVARKRLFAALAPSAVIDASGASHSLPGGVPVEEGDLLVIATSGTTGDPKGVILTKSAAEASAAATSERLDVDPARDHWLCCLPLSHVGGLSVVIRAILSGTRLTVHPGFDAPSVEASVRDGVTLTSLVPTALRRLSNECIASLRTIVLGGSAPPSDRPTNTVSTYGLTETGSGVVYDGLALRDTEVRIAGDGEIELRAPMLLRAYRDGTDPKDPEGWFATGDAGSIGDDGILSVKGRVKELIVTGGENVWPQAVENVLARHRSLAEVAVIGLPDPEWGERVVAVGVLADGEKAPELEELRDLIRGEIAAFAAPKELIIVDALPRTSIGKLRRVELAASLTTASAG